MDYPTHYPMTPEWSDRPLRVERWFTCWVLQAVAWLIVLVSPMQKAVESGKFAFNVYELIARSPSEALALNMQGMFVTLSTIAFLASPAQLWLKRRRQPDAWNAITVGCMVLIWVPPLTNSYSTLKPAYLVGYIQLAIAYTISAVSIHLCCTATDRELYWRFRRRPAIVAAVALGVGIVAASTSLALQVAPFAFIRAILAHPMEFIVVVVLDPVMVMAHLLFYGGVIVSTAAIYRLAKSKLPAGSRLPTGQSTDAPPHQHGFPVILDRPSRDQ